MMRLLTFLALAGALGCADGGSTSGAGGSRPVLTGLDAYVYRAPVAVDADLDAAVALTFDHAALVGAEKARADGTDLRLVTVTGGAPTEIDRILEPTSSWDDASTTIWFKTRAGASYYLYYGSAMPDPALDNGANVYMVWDDFEAAELDEAWEVGFAGTASGAAVPTDGALRVQGVSGDIASMSDDFVFVSREISGDFIADVGVRGVGGSLGALAKMGGLMIRQSSLPDSRFCMMSLYQSPRAYIAATRLVESDDVSDAQLEIENTFPRFLALVRDGGGVTPQYSEGGSDYVSLGTQAMLGLADPAFLGIPFANISGEFGHVDIDWVRVRKVPSTAPNVTVGAEEKL
jgi:hypothetical protein